MDTQSSENKILGSYFKNDNYETNKKKQTDIDNK